MARKHTFRRWVELEAALHNAGLKLYDVSRESKIDERRTELSIQYLTDLRSGRYIYGPNDKVLGILAAAIGVSVDDIKPHDDEDDIPVAA